MGRKRPEKMGRGSNPVDETGAKSGGVINTRVARRPDRWIPLSFVSANRLHGYSEQCNPPQEAKSKLEASSEVLSTVPIMSAPPRDLQSVSSCESKLRSKIRIKLEYENSVKIVVLPLSGEFSIFRKLMVESFSALSSLNEGLLKSGSQVSLEARYCDTSGEQIVVDDNESLQQALLELQQQADIPVPKFTITVTNSSPFYRPPILLAPGSPSGGGGRIICRNFQVGRCSFGARCRFSHNDVTSRVLQFRSSKQMEAWLHFQLKKPASENIVYLSNGKGLAELSDLVEQQKLSETVIEMLISLLGKQEIRSSMMLENTNKIYGILPRSSFLTNLSAHIQALPNPSSRALQAYISVLEEIQTRTSDGWKVIPLDAVKSHLESLPGSSVKDALANDVARLLAHRHKQRWLLATEKPHDTLKGKEFQNMSIVPSQDELLSREHVALPLNLVGVRYTSIMEYLETQFLLLREDFIEPLRAGIRSYQMPAVQASHDRVQELRVYRHVQLVGLRCGSSGMEFRLSFRVKPSRGASRLEADKSLMMGSLLCISQDDFQSVQGCAIVAHRDATAVANPGMIDVQFIGPADQWLLDIGKVYVMVESSSAYFEAYSHALKCLQQEEMENIPFSRYLVNLEPMVNPPSYLLASKNGLQYDMSCIFRELEGDVGRKTLNVLEEWPSFTSSLDCSQMRALRHALTKEIALIQGPPGTGKTFIGLLAVRVLLANLYSSVLQSSSIKDSPSFSLETENALVQGPILVVCFTNHALDQFLEGIYKYEKCLIRLGGRSKSVTLQERSLYAIQQQQRSTRTLDRVHLHELTGSKREKSELEKRLTELLKLMELKVATQESLHGVATEDQIAHLFFNDADTENSHKTVEVWLESPYDPGYRMNLQALRDTVGDETDLEDRMDISNPYSALQDEVDTWSDGEYSSESSSTSAEAFGPDHTNSTLQCDPVAGAVVSEERSPLDECNTSSGQDRIGYAGPVPNSAGAGGVSSNGNRQEIEIHVEDQVDVDINRPEEDFYRAEFGTDQGWREDGQAYPLQDIIDYPDVWHLDKASRFRLHNFWLEEIKQKASTEMKTVLSQYETACRAVATIDSEISLSLLRKARVVGLTTTSAARHHELLVALKPEIIIVEEAAEVLEAHIVACLSPFTKHLILIGDHLQLRPSVAVYNLAVQHKLDVSMFERLATGGVQHVTLEMQRRMRPSIATLITPIYGPRLQNHPSVSTLDDVKGVKSNVFFLDHTAEESSSGDAGSKKNVEEAKLVVEFCSYLLKQGYSPKHITILSMYSGQISHIKGLLADRKVGVSKHTLFTGTETSSADLSVPLEGIHVVYPTVTSVDNFQGEECDIIILSLVRSNQHPGKDRGLGKIGFVGVANRVCVALSRARIGLYMFGNSKLLCLRSSLWEEVIDSLNSKQCLGPELILSCQNHPETETKITNAIDFNLVQDGGCNRPCLYQLDCGHACPRRCHPGGHENVACPKPCARKHELCDHNCISRCHGESECPPCVKRVSKLLSQCGHSATISCSQAVDTYVCQRPCEEKVDCGHPCPRRCGNQCVTPETCKVRIEKVLTCGHTAQVPCSQDIAVYLCREPCTSVLPECGHFCKGTCGTCQQGISHVPCKEKCARIMPCSHPCQEGCLLSCPPCSRKCQRRCMHSNCSHKCGLNCRPCIEPCAWRCKHFRCPLRCYQICRRPRCDEPCKKTLRKCKHPCCGLCGEPCPKCRLCHPEEFDVIAQMKLSEFDEADRFIQLQDCGHVFEVTGLDGWMDHDDATSVPTDADSISASVAMKLKQCPACKTPIQQTFRYSSSVKTRLAQIDEIKRRIYAIEMTREGNELLKTANPITALGHFIEALRQNPELLQAHFGMGCAHSALNQGKEAISCLSLVVERSPLAADMVTNVIGTSSSSCAALGSKLNNIGVDRSVTRADKALGIQATLQWAQCLGRMGNLSQASLLCDVVLKHDPECKAAKTMKDQAAERHIFKQVVEIMTAEVGGRGHWYSCPSGHFYVVGECGGPMQTSRCPDCAAVIGGQSHRPAEGNTHATIDGSTHAAWSDAAGLHGPP